MTPSPLRPEAKTETPRPPAQSRAADLRLGDRIQLRKPHPCGAFVWEVTRLGADIGLRCEGCQRKVLLSRAVVGKRMKALVARAERPEVDGLQRTESTEADDPRGERA